MTVSAPASQLEQGREERSLQRDGIMHERTAHAAKKKLPSCHSPARAGLWWVVTVTQAELSWRLECAGREAGRQGKVTKSRPVLHRPLL